MELKSIKQVVSHKLCIGCGLCELDNSISMIVENGRLQPNNITKCNDIENSCPAKGYDLNELGHFFFGDVHHCPEIGYYRDIKTVRSNDEKVLKNASSGGIITQIALFFLSKGLIDGVITNKYVIHNNKVRTETFVAQTEEDLIVGQGSKYCPTSTLSILKMLSKEKKYLLIGTPCQIAGFRLLSLKNEIYKNMIPYTIANFCGGYRDYRELDFFVEDVAHIKNVNFFRHRGGGQPGSMLIMGENNKTFQYPYPDYATLSHFVKNERCTLCMDATGELADFSCGDAWLNNMSTPGPWSIIITRSETASRLVHEMIKENTITTGDVIDENQVIDSQRLNITSKKYRQYKRIATRDFFFKFSPNWFCNYPTKEGSYFQELKIILSKLKTELLTKYHVKN